MGHKILIDPLVVLNPVSFAFHLAVFAELDEPVAVPLGWLWEEIGRRYTLLTSADILAYHSGNDNASFGESIYNESLPALNASAALLAVGTRRGLIRPIATRDVGRFLREGDWVTYLADLVGHWDEIEPLVSVYEKADKVAASEVANEFGIKPHDVMAIFERNVDWSKRTAKEYPVYERFRVLRVELSQLYAFLEAGYDVSTPSDYIRKLVTEKLDRYGLVSTVGSQNPLLPILRKVAFDPRPFTVSDILAMVESKELFKKLGGVELGLCELIKSEKHGEFGKNLSIYLLGLIPGLGAVANILGAIDLLQDAYKLLSEADDGESVLYFDKTKVEPRTDKYG